MGDLIMGIGLIGVGLSGMIAMEYVRRKLPIWQARKRRFDRMSAVQLHAEITRCTGAIMQCARTGDRRGMRYAHRAMKPIMRALMAK